MRTHFRAPLRASFALIACCGWLAAAHAATPLDTPPALAPAADNAAKAASRPMPAPRPAPPAASPKAPVKAGPITTPDTPPTTGVASEPRVQNIVVEDDNARIDELRVRGFTQRIVVSPKVGPKGQYEIITGDGSRDLGDGANTSRGAAGKRVWNVLKF